MPIRGCLYMKKLLLCFIFSAICAHGSQLVLLPKVAHAAIAYRLLSGLHGLDPVPLFESKVNCIEKERIAEYDSNNNRIVLYPYFSAMSGSSQIFTLLHELRHQRQFDLPLSELKLLRDPFISKIKASSLCDMTEEEGSLLFKGFEQDADRFASSCIHCPLCLTITKIEKTIHQLCDISRVERGYFGACDFDRCIQEKFQRAIFCKAHQASEFQKLFLVYLNKDQLVSKEFKNLKERLLDKLRSLPDSQREEFVREGNRLLGNDEKMMLYLSKAFGQDYRAYVGELEKSKQDIIDLDRKNTKLLDRLPEIV